MTPGVARCVQCSCDDLHACTGGCWWLAVDYDQGTGVCSNCRPALKAWNNQREQPAPVPIGPPDI